MARYDLYENPLGDGFLLDVQADTLDELTTRVVIPLFLARSTPPKARRLHPVFNIAGVDYVLATQLITAVPASELRHSKDNLMHHHDDIVAALDMLFQGF